MKKPRNFKSRSQVRVTGAPGDSSSRERLIVTACFAAFVLVLAAYCTVSGIIAERAALHRQMLEWTASYHLTAEQAARIVQIEAKFHGNGNPFTSRESGTPEENDAHHVEISRVMAPEDGGRFLEVMVKNGGSH